MIGPEGAQGHPHRVGIIGGGFGGLFAARALQRAEVEVAPPIRDILRQENTRVVLGEVVDVDLGVRRLAVDVLDRRTTVPSDSLIVAWPLGRMLADKTGAEVDRAGRVKVEPDLTVVGRIRSAGFGAWLLWLLVHVVGLTGFKNRVAAFYNWAVAFLGRGRPQRVITTQQVFARRALELHPAAMPNVPVTRPGQ